MSSDNIRASLEGLMGRDEALEAKEIREALDRMTLELECWCDSWHPHAYTEPTKSLRMISSIGRRALQKASRLEGRHD